MKTSHTVLISATAASSFVIGMNYAPIISYNIFAVLALTAVFTLIVKGIQFIIKNPNEI
ncbi:hypothetical protein BOW86_gp082 [Synechococcus phage S-CAM7]|uniref:Uncharacterized protein n=1 Tax=Synechococcus phage S-CAM7 TaxID=1883368 RepID=A0A1D8KTM7_9CAUD|nr:hypothetical protein BOW86_gp082 [Synechococcus phage S-CAM7]AOV62006.1 hypothetical protein C490910_082 [Synechococcus phage S-CAM7]AOV62271.1 hypothetical protein S420910_082 [Synechococcus phage S-CAM7]QLF86139.1 hypothetical protein CC030809_00083 [Synechococcus phage S-CAM7]